MTTKTKKRVTPPKGPRTSMRIIKSFYFLQGGPWGGQHLYLESSNTLVMNIGNQIGRYVEGKWEAVCA